MINYYANSLGQVSAFIFLITLIYELNFTPVGSFFAVFKLDPNFL